MGFPGYNAIMPESAKSVANYLEEEGYVNYALGKWDHTPLYEVSQVGPFDRWPSGEGFQHAYTSWRPTCTSSCRSCGTTTRPSRTASPVHLDQDLADRAIEWITGHKSIKPDLPVHDAVGVGLDALAAPCARTGVHRQVRRQFDMGWDVAREQILENEQKRSASFPPTRS